MATFRLDITGAIEGLTSGQLKMVLPTITGSAAVGDLDIVNFSSGDNTITLQTATTVLVVIPPTNNAQTLTLKGAAGDTGLDMEPTKPLVYVRESTTTSVIINAGGTVNGVEVWQF